MGKLQHAACGAGQFAKRFSKLFYRQDGICKADGREIATSRGHNFETPKSNTKSAICRS